MVVSAGAIELSVRPNLAGLQAELTAAMGPIGASAAASLNSSLSSGLKKAGASMTSAGRTLTRSVSLPLLGIGAISTKMALDYDKAFTQIAATTNQSQKQIDEWRKSVLRLSEETAQSPEELADALYFLASAGLDAQEVTDALEVSAKASAAGLGETADIAKITANALNAYASEGLKAADVTDTLVAAVREGTADPEEFSGALGRILPIASKAEVSFDEVAASLATVSNIGLDVNEGVTAMRGLMQALVAPTKQSQDALKELGLTTDDVRDSLANDGLLDTLDLLDEKSHGQIETIQQLIPNVRSLTGFFGLQGQEAEKVDAIFEHLADSSGSLDKAFKTTKESNAFKFQKGLNDLSERGIKLGNQLIPILVDTVIPAVQDAVKWFTKLSPETKELGIKLAGLAIAVGPILRLAGGITSLVGGLIKLGSGAVALGIRALGGVAAASTAEAVIPEVVGAGAGVAGAAGGAAVGATTAAGGAAAATGLLGPTGLPIASGGAAAATAGAGVVAIPLGVVLGGALVVGGGAAIISHIKEQNNSEATRELIDRYNRNDQTLADLQQQLAAQSETRTEFGSGGAVEIQADARGAKVTQEAIDQITAHLKDQVGALNLSNPEWEKYLNLVDSAAPMSKSAARELGILVSAQDDAKFHYSKLNLQMAENLLQSGDTAGAIAILREGYDKAVKPVENLATQQERLKESTADLAQRQRGAAGASGDVTKQMHKADEAAQGLTRSFEQTGGSAHVADGKVQNYKGALDDIPKSKSTTITTPGLAEATSGVQGLASGLNGLKSTYVINVQLNREGWPGRAAGGPVMAGQPYVVGEHGPEVFVSDEAGRIIPNEPERLRRGHDGGGGHDGGTSRMVLLEGKVDVDSGRIRILAREEIDGENRYRRTRERAHA